MIYGDLTSADIRATVERIMEKAEVEGNLREYIAAVLMDERQRCWQIADAAEAHAVSMAIRIGRTVR